MENNEEIEDDKKQERDRKKILDDVKRLAQKAQETAEGKQSKLFEDEDLNQEDTGFDQTILNDTVNPELSHRLYYSIQRLLRDNLPTGRKNRPLRRYVYDEKNLFLNQGNRVDHRGIRNSDGRMAPPETILQEGFNMVVQWVSSGGSPFDIFYTFRKKNEDLGYYDKKEPPIDVPYTDITNETSGLLEPPQPTGDE